MGGVKSLENSFWYSSYGSGVVVSRGGLIFYAVYNWFVTELGSFLPRDPLGELGTFNDEYCTGEHCTNEDCTGKDCTDEDYVVAYVRPSFWFWRSFKSLRSDFPQKTKEANLLFFIVVLDLIFII